MKYNYERLPLARQLRKLTQKEAAQLAGLSQANLSKAEVGFLELSDESIMKLSEVYDFPLSFLCKIVNYRQMVISIFDEGCLCPLKK